MRILVVSVSDGRGGGIEIYLRNLLEALPARRHEVAFLHQYPAAPGERSLAPDGMTVWCAAGMGRAAALEAVAAWRPDAVFAHQLPPGDLVSRLQADWPSLYFAHCYLGVCVSTTKCRQWPTPQPCQRRLGWGCLVQYFPRRCGGWNPRTLWRLFREQRQAQAHLRGFNLLATHSDYVRDEYRRHGFPDDRVRKIPFWVRGGGGSVPAGPRSLPETGPLRILFLGRFEAVKGGNLLLDAAALAVPRLGRGLRLTLAGTGPARAAWEGLARRRQASTPGLEVAFPGWVDGARREALLAASEVLAAPSVWPEPFGMTGIEAGFHGVPTVAFDVGGVREWLEDGVNGRRAPGAPPTAAGLADALVDVLSDPARYRRLSAGALAAPARFGADAHLEAVERLLVEVRGRRGLRLASGSR